MITPSRSRQTFGLGKWISEGAVACACTSFSGLWGLQPAALLPASLACGDCSEHNGSKDGEVKKREKQEKNYYMQRYGGLAKWEGMIKLGSANTLTGPERSLKAAVPPRAPPPQTKGRGGTEEVSDPHRETL